MPRGIPKKKWNVGDLFVVQTSDGKFVLSQIIGQERSALNSVSVAFFDCRTDNPEDAGKMATSVTVENVFSILLATRDLLDSGKWQLTGHHNVLIPPTMLPYENLREKGFIGAKIYGSGNINKFLNAFYALAPWDAWPNSNYLDAFLISPEKKPKKLIYK